MGDESPHHEPRTETTAVTDSSGFDIPAKDIMRIIDFPTNIIIRNQADVPITMTLEGKAPASEICIEMAEAPALFPISNPKSEATSSSACTSIVLEVTTTLVSDIQDDAIIAEALLNMIELEPISKAMNHQADCHTAETFATLDHEVMKLDQQNETSIEEEVVAPTDGNTLGQQKPVADKSYAIATITGEHRGLKS